MGQLQACFAFSGRWASGSLLRATWTMLLTCVACSLSTEQSEQHPAGHLQSSLDELGGAVTIAAAHQCRHGHQHDQHTPKGR